MSDADPAATPPIASDSVEKCKVMPPLRAMALRAEAYRILGVDLTTIPGISVLHVQCIVAGPGRRHLKVPKRQGIQFMDGALPGQRYQWR